MIKITASRPIDIWIQYAIYHQRQ